MHATKGSSSGASLKHEEKLLVYRKITTSRNRTGDQLHAVQASRNEENLSEDNNKYDAYPSLALAVNRSTKANVP
jgi:hypothetical protein